jgi:hypothetical protein
VEEFYRGFAQRARDLAEKADPFTRRRLLDLAERYDLKGRGSSNGRTPAPRATPPSALFSGAGEAGGSVLRVRWNIGSALVFVRKCIEPFGRTFPPVHRRGLAQAQKRATSRRLGAETCKRPVLRRLQCSDRWAPISRWTGI